MKRDTEVTGVLDLIREQEAVAFARALTKGPTELADEELGKVLHWVGETWLRVLMIRMVLDGVAVVTWDDELQQPKFTADTSNSNDTTH